MTRPGLVMWVKDPTGGAGTIRAPAGSPGGIGGQFIERDAQAIIRMFDNLAQEAQANVVSNIESSIKRRSVSTGRLARVTADPKNRYADQFGFGVGVIDFLDKSMAKYWRSFEEGPAKAWADTPGGASTMVGMQLRGRFGGTIIGWRATATPGPQPQPLAGAPWGAAGGKLRWMWSMPLNENFKVRYDYPGRLAYHRAYTEGGVFTSRPQKGIARYLQNMVNRMLRPDHPYD